MDDFVGPRNQVNYLREVRQMAADNTDEAANLLGLPRLLQEC